MKLYEIAYICSLYPVLADFDSSLKEFRRKTRRTFDVNDTAHKQALFEWLNSWGCRQFSKAHYSTASRSLVAWAKRYLDQLPREKDALLALSDVALDVVADAYGDLRDRLASRRSGGESGKYNVGFGPTGAAKVLFALRPNAFPPWDDPIRTHFKFDGSSDSYHRFLKKVQSELSDLENDAKRFEIQLATIPRRIGRPDSTLPKIVDEYYWAAVTNGIKPPSRKELEDWALWARG